MPRVRAPLFGFSARGTLANSLTYSRRKGVHLVGLVPFHLDSKTLSQYYQRWRFQDAAFIWHTLTTAERAPYIADASTFRISPWSAWLRSYLRDQTYLMAEHRLDSFPGGISIDTSSWAQNGGVTNATIAQGIIDQCGDFNGINAEIEITHAANLLPTDAFTLACFVNLDGAPNAWAHIADKGNTYRLLFDDAGNVYASIFRTIGEVAGWNERIALTPGAWYHVAYTYDGNLVAANLKTFINGVYIGATTGAGVFAQPATTMRIGSAFNAGNPYSGLIDQYRLYSRVLSPSHIAALAARMFL